MVFIIIFRLILAFLVNFKLSFRLKRLEFLFRNIKCNVHVRIENKATSNQPDNDLTLHLRHSEQPEGL